MKKRLFILLFILFLFCPKNTYASSSLKLTNKIESISNSIKGNITYKIIPHAENPKEVENEPNDIKVSFEDIEVDEYTLTAETIIDFSNTIYKIPGTYRYGIMQKSTDNKSINLVKDTYEIYVNVTQDSDGTIHTDVSPLIFDFDTLEKHELEYTNTVNYTNMVIEHKVDSSYKESDKDLYFKYKLKIYGPIGHKYTITGQDEEITYNNEVIKTATEYEVKDNDNDNYVYLYLKDGQKVTIGLNENEFNEIPIKTEYSIAKIDGEKWLTIIDDKEQDSKTGILEEENYILIINERSFDNAVTGLFYKIYPYIILLVVSIVVIIFIRKLKLKK